MIKKINELQCINCGLCEDICPMDVFWREKGKISIAYVKDCCDCQRCLACPTDAIVLAPGVRKEFDTGLRWQQVKEALNMKQER